MSEVRSRRWPNWIRWLGTLISLGLLIWLLERQDWDTLLSVTGSVGWGVLLLSLGLVFLSQVLNIFRWYALLRSEPEGLGFGAAFRLTFAGLFASNFLPTTVGGDVLRLAGVMNAADDRLRASTTIVLDRLAGMLGMALLLPFGMPILAGWLGGGSWLGAGAVAGDGRVHRWLRGGWDQFKRLLRLWRSSPQFLVASLMFSLAAIAAYLASVWWLADAMGIPVGYWDVAGATSLTYFLTLLPFSVNGYGLRELGVVAVYTQLGGSAEQAAALALLTRGLLWTISLAGMLWLGEALQAAGQQVSTITASTEAQS